MNNILLTCVFALVSLGCATTQSKNAELNAARQNTQESPTPPAANNDKNLLDELREANKRPTLPANPNPVNEATYIVNKLDQNKIKMTTLDRQPQEIIEHILQGQSSEERFERSLKEIKVQVEEHDLNHDGEPERILIARLFSNQSVPVFYIFASENQKWSNSLLEIDLGFPDSDPSEVEILTKSDKNGFDLIKVSEVYGDKEVMKDVVYYQMKNGKYEVFECRKVEGVKEKTIPCR